MVAPLTPVYYGRPVVILSFYERKDSPWVWAQYAMTGHKPKQERTRIRKTDPQKDAKLARVKMEIEAELAEAADAAQHSGDSQEPNDAGWGWVTRWIASRFTGRTREVYRAQWRSLGEFVHVSGISGPRLLAREDCFAYADWRRSKRKEKSGRLVSANTAIGELKLLAQVMDEAKLRGLCRGDNPARKLRLQGEDARIKPEIRDEELKKIYAKLQQASTPQWMLRSFVLALNTGLRFAETQLERSQVDWSLRVILIEKPKGGRGKAFSIPIYETVEVMLREWWDSGAPQFLAMTDAERKITGITWTKFFRSIDLPHVCFHCTRVTFISRGARAGIPEGMMMKLVNHASADVHRIYQRLPPGDAAMMVAKIVLPKLTTQ